jgi:Mrp family chromosome partitioning ATPase
VLLFDLPPGAERTIQFAEFLGARPSFVLVTIPRKSPAGSSRARSRRCQGRQRLLGYVENMSGYCCADCGEVKPLFPETKDGIVLDPLLGPRPLRSGARLRVRSGVAFLDLPETAATRALSAIAAG